MLDSPNRPPTMADVPEEDYFLISIDYGTSTLDAKYRLVRSGMPLSVEGITSIKFNTTTHWEPQKIAWDKEGNFYWGQQVHDAIEEGLITHDDTVELTKLLLYDDYKNHPLVKAIMAHLEKCNKTTPEILTQHFGAIFRAILDIMKENSAKHGMSSAWSYTKEEVDTLPIKVLLSVPQMWKAPENNIMITAAKDAAVATRIQLVREPEVAAACFTHHVTQALPTRFNPGDVIIIADIGGGTGDFVSYKYLTSSDEGAAVRLELFGVPAGSSCGSELVNQKFLQWFLEQVETHHGGMPKLRKTIAQKESTILKIAVESFRTLKHKFTGSSKPGELLYIGQGGPNGKYVHFPFNAEDMRSFFDPAIDLIIQAIEGQIQSQDPGQTKAILLPGGFSQSKYVMSKIRSQFEGRVGSILGQRDREIGGEHPVTLGALLRYDDIVVGGLPSTDSFGFGRIEVWDEAQHPDATIQIGLRTPNGTIAPRTVPDPKLVKPNRLCRGTYDVFERWTPILSKGETREPGKEYSSETWQHHQIHRSYETLNVQIYWTELDINEHDPIFDGPVKNGKLRDGIKKWGEKMYWTLPNLSTLGFDLKEGNVYEFYSRLVLTCNGANVDVKWEIALPGTEPYNENGDFLPKIEPNFTDSILTFQLCEERYNPTPRQEPM